MLTIAFTNRAEMPSHARHIWFQPKLLSPVFVDRRFDTTANTSGTDDYPANRLRIYLIFGVKFIMSNYDVAQKVFIDHVVRAFLGH
ncbi:hypothetical protein [Paraburkholderia sp. GAS42]|uniref:hypothetical protein n=1 Tax=Paraburkholderia sp. GAS42 TaxID=3035135 RepID=UPI003D1B5603